MPFPECGDEGAVSGKEVLEDVPWAVSASEFQLVEEAGSVAQAHAAEVWGTHGLC